MSNFGRPPGPLSNCQISPPVRHVPACQIPGRARAPPPCQILGPQRAPPVVSNCQISELPLRQTVKFRPPSGPLSVKFSKKRSSPVSKLFGAGGLCQIIGPPRAPLSNSPKEVVAACQYSAAGGARVKFPVPRGPPMSKFSVAPCQILRPPMSNSFSRWERRANGDEQH